MEQALLLGIPIEGMLLDSRFRGNDGMGQLTEEEEFIGKFTHHPDISELRDLLFLS